MFTPARLATSPIRMLPPCGPVPGYGCQVLGLDQHFERLAVVHRAVAVWHADEAGRPVEDPAGLDLALEDVGHQPLDVGARRRGPAREHEVGEEALLRARDRLSFGDADTADGAAWSRAADRREYRLVGTDALQHRVGAEAVRQLAHALDRLVASLLDDLVGAEFA